MNEDSKQIAQAEIPKNLKGIYQRLQEIGEVLISPQDGLDTLVNGEHPVSAETAMKVEIGTSDMPTMENIVSVIDNIDRNAHKISRHVNRLVGN